jgi:tRNA uridine 5-carbamoylmethylation protein Kti12
MSLQSNKEENYNPVPQAAPGASAAVGHTVENSIPLSIFPIATDKFCICFCGLPGRGKTHISRRLGRYLQFFHAVPVGIFNVSEYRRKYCGALKDAEWFDPTNQEAQTLRSQTNAIVYADLIQFLNENANGVAILDSTNHSHERRNKLLKQVRAPSERIV